MEVKVLLFARLREVFRQDEVIIDIERGSRASDLLARLVSLKPELKPLAAKLNVAVNQDVVSGDYTLADSAAEIAVFPPVGGG